MPRFDWKTLKTLIVSRDEMKGLVTMPEVISLVEQAFRAHGRGAYIMDPKVHIIMSKYNGEWEAMPSYLGEPESSACKWVAIREKNRENFGLPTIMSTIVYTHPETGFPLMICDGTYHTNMRTGASAAVSAKWLARKNAKTIGLVGAGAVAVGVVRAINALGKFEEVRVWSRRKKNADAFVKRLRDQVELKLEAVSDVKRAVEDADIVVTATLATTPVVKDEWIREGTHITALGADMEGKQELEGKLLKRSRIFVDDLDQCIRDGEINTPLKKGDISVASITATIGEVICGKKPGRLSDKDITIFDSTGIALQDAAVITLEYKRALQRGVGIEKRMTGSGLTDF
ncbi:MAG: ornithine cyclodeaminase family protein [Candidatus Bathyarchaeia archaeon]